MFFFSPITGSAMVIVLLAMSTPLTSPPTPCFCHSSRSRACFSAISPFFMAIIDAAKTDLPSSASFPRTRMRSPGWTSCNWIGAASLGLALAGVFTLVVPPVDAIKNFEPFLTAIDAMLPQGEPVRAIGADETLLGIVPFVTGRRVVPIDTNDLAEAPFVLVQSVDEAPSPLALESSYERVALRQFGPSRRMALWRRRGDPSP